MKLSIKEQNNKINKKNNYSEIQKNIIKKLKEMVFYNILIYL